MNALGGWNWENEVYKTSVVLVSCAAADIRQRIREAVPREVQVADALLESSGFGDIDVTNPPAARCVSMRRDGYTVTAIWLNPKASPAIVAHEAFHAAYHILGFAGVMLTDASEEAFAYLLEWFVRGISNCLDGSTAPAPPVTLDTSVPGRFPLDPRALAGQPHA